MKTYRISIWEEQSGYFDVKAKNKKEARKIVEKVELYGIEEVAKNYRFDVMHRQVELLN